MSDAAEGPIFSLARWGQQIRLIELQRPNPSRATLAPTRITDGFIEWTYRAEEEDGA